MTAPRGGGIDGLEMPDFTLIPEDATLTDVSMIDGGSAMGGPWPLHRPRHQQPHYGHGFFNYTPTKVLKVPLARAWRMVRPTGASTGHAPAAQASKVLWNRGMRSRFLTPPVEAFVPRQPRGQKRRLEG